MDPEKVKAILEWPDLTSVPNVLSFLGLVNFYHRYLGHLAEIATPFSDLLKDENPFIWGPDQVHAFWKLKQTIANNPILSHFTPADPIEVHCYASNKAIGTTMVQNGHPIMFES